MRLPGPDGTLLLLGSDAPRYISNAVIPVDGLYILQRILEGTGGWGPVFEWPALIFSVSPIR
jgi:hypothetical protein